MSLYQRGSCSCALSYLIAPVFSFASDLDKRFTASNSCSGEVWYIESKISCCCSDLDGCSPNMNTSGVISQEGGVHNEHSSSHTFSRGSPSLILGEITPYVFLLGGTAI